MHTGIVAASRLQAAIKSRDYSIDIAEMRMQVGKISEAVRSVVPESMWGQIIAKLNELEQYPEALDVGVGSFDDADDDPYDPTEFAEDDDDF